MQAGIVALDEEDVQLVPPAAFLLPQAQVAGRNIDLHLGAGVHGDYVGDQRNFAYVSGPPHRLVIAILERGRFLLEEIAGTVARREAVLLAGELDGDDVVLVIGRTLGRKTQQV